ncbi:MAG: chemotaxis protein CheW [Myxococcales bacterium]|nr:chemotaxis protein CheW [Myxococcales bacterium]
MERQESQPAAGGARVAGAGKYLTFRLGEEEYGLEILKVRELIGLMEITPVPMTPEYIRGVINLRGKVIPVVDLRLKFGLQPTPDNDRKTIIVVDVKKPKGLVQMGVLVDLVSEVAFIAADDIEAPPSFGDDYATSFILGMGKSKGVLKVLLDIDVVLGSSDVISAAVHAPAQPNANAAASSLQ